MYAKGNVLTILADYNGRDYADLNPGTNMASSSPTSDLRLNFLFRPG